MNFKIKLKEVIKLIIINLSQIEIGRKICDLFSEVSYKKVSVIHKNIKLNFISTNSLTDYRYTSFSTKEPDTLEWIETINENKILWDVGANIGLYSVYAAFKVNANVFAFEPSVLNLELLARNIFINGLIDKIKIIPFPLSDKLSFESFNLSSTKMGAALHNFGDVKGSSSIQKENFTYNILGISMNDANKLLGIPLPNYLKIDVDGIENLILRGGADILLQVESVLIEINENDEYQASEAVKLLKNAGLHLYRKIKINSFKEYNQWWIRNNRI